MKIKYMNRGYHIVLNSRDYTVGGDTIDDLKREFFRILENEIDAAINEKLRQPDNNGMFYMDLDDLK